ncbi:MAG: hypothetical protein ACTSYD_14870 [Candidatus Heimdallarchaeaceae archaeon]
MYKQLSSSDTSLKASDFGVVIFKFDPDDGPILMSNDSLLSEDDVSRLIIKSISVLMSSVEYSLFRSRTFRGIIPINQDFYAYCFDLLLVDDVALSNTLVPFLIFLIFPKSLIVHVGSNLLILEDLIYSFSSPIVWLSQFSTDFGRYLLDYLQYNLSS